MTARLQKLRQQITIGVVGGSDLVKQKEQLGENGVCVCDGFSSVAVVTVSTDGLVYLVQS